MRDMYFETKSGYFLQIYPCDEGYDFSYYNPDKVLIGGGILESDDFMKLKDILKEIYEFITKPDLDKELKDLLQYGAIKKTEKIIENIKI